MAFLSDIYNSDDAASYNYRILYERSPLAYQMLDGQGNILHVNSAWCELFGISRDEVSGKSFTDFLVNDVSGNNVLASMAEHLPDGSVKPIACRISDQDNNEKDIFIEAWVEEDGLSRERIVYCILHDVAGYRKKHQVTESYSKIFENSLHEIYIFDVEDFHYLKVNRGACRNTGYSEMEFEGATPEQLMPGMSRANLARLLEPIQKGTEDIIQFETIHLRKNRTFYYVDVHIQPTLYLSRPAYLAVVLDISKNKEVKNRLDLVIQGAELGYWDWNYQSGEFEVNQRWLDMLGLTRDDLDKFISDWGERLHPEDRLRMDDVLKQSIENHHSYSVDFRMKHQQGHWVWVHSAGAVVAYDRDNQTPLRLCGTHQDINERKSNDTLLRKLSQAVEQSPNMVIITDTLGNIEYANPKIKEISGYGVDEVIGRNTRMFSSGETPKEVYLEIWNTIKSGMEWRGVLHNRKKNGDLFWVKESIAPIRDENNTITHFVAIQEDITESKKVAEQLSYQATHDSLTDLINRREFERRLKTALNVAKQDNCTHVLCYLDMDQFKIINDTCTHVAGDELLKQFSCILRENFRSSDIIARLGGDEFAVLMEYCSVNMAAKHAQKLLETIGEFQFVWNNKSFRIGVSIGIVQVDNSEKDVYSLLSKADVACYAAKNEGRHCIHRYQAKDKELSLINQDNQWISRVNHALDEDLFELYAQPICKLSDDVISTKDHWEVLIRIRDGDNVIAPGAFMPTVERFNLSLRLDQWVIRHVFSWLEQRAENDKKRFCLSINISAQNLGNKQLLAFIFEEFNRTTRLEAKNICFEITETAAINNLTEAKAFINKLKEVGFKFSVDDFGSGLSSFNYLRNLPVDYLKIDGQFVKGIVDDPVDYAMVRSINEIGQVMGKKTIAEFVENKEILDKLKTLNVDYVQGYYLGKPKPIKLL